MSARALAVAALALVAVAGCQGAGTFPGADVLGTIASVAGVPIDRAPDVSLADVRGAFVDIDEPEEVELGRAVAAAIGGRYPLLRDAALTRYVGLVGNAVAVQSERPDLRYAFGVLDTAEVNAFAAPGGFVLVTKGALALMPDEAALAGVLGHEVGHIALRHHAETIKAQRRKGLAMSGLASGLSQTPVGAFSGLISLTADALTEQIVLKGFSRGEEMASDRVGFDYAARAGYDPAGLRDFLTALAARGTRDAGAAAFFSTHPGTDERLQAQRSLRQAFTGGGRREAERFARAIGRPA